MNNEYEKYVLGLIGGFNKEYYFQWNIVSVFPRKPMRGKMNQSTLFMNIPS